MTQPPLSQDLVRLPEGVRDWLPGDASTLHSLRRRLLATLDAGGYERVMTPTFEYLDVLLRGTDLREERIFKLVEPETGAVLALRPDITPQIARMAATALRPHAPPLRLCYYGAVFRLEGRHSGDQREVYQVGAECLGVPGARGDAEVLALMAEALSEAGLEDITIDLGHTGFLRNALGVALPSPRDRMRVEEALRRKDAGAVAKITSEAGATTPELAALVVALPSLYGDLAVLERARRIAPAEVAGDALDELADLGARLADAGFAAHVSVDLGEVRGLGYHSGVVYQAFAHGTGRPLGGGGRYDELTARYGRPLPATGFALDVGAVLEATWRRS